LIFDYGMIYIPDACLNQPCDFHIHFHGCHESVAIWDTLYARQTGILEYAAANDMIVLFPQSGDPSGVFPFTYCWYSAMQEGETPQHESI
jgi:hypothetical protein